MVDFLIQIWLFQFGRYVGSSRFKFSYQNRLVSLTYFFADDSTGSALPSWLRPQSLPGASARRALQRLQERGAVVGRVHVRLGGGGCFFGR